MNQVQSHKNKWDPPLFKYFYLVRIAMLMLICIDYFHIIPDTAWWKIPVIALSMIVLACNHLVFQFNKIVQSEYYKISMAIDFFVASFLGYIEPGIEHPYFILYGIIIITLWLSARSEKEVYKLLIGMAVLWICLLIYTYTQVNMIGLTDFFINLGFLAFCYFAGYLIRHYQRVQMQIRNLYEKLEESHLALQDTHEQLRSYANQIEDLIATREQNRIAREIHDTVGHTMTALLVQLQVAKKLVDRDPIKSKETLVISEDLARSALQDVRTAVRALKEENRESGSFLDGVRKLLMDFSDMSEMKTTLQIEGEFTNMSIALQSAIYRIIQESLTNAKRHGNATEANVFLVNQDQEIQLCIQDNGKGAPLVAPSFGLQGMRERVHELGGTVQFTTEPSMGFQVQVRIPLKQQVWSYGG
jgi:signal transduction histidine kinase